MFSPIIVVPGITASVLRDEYELPPELVWTTVSRKRYERIAMHPRDQRYEALEPARVVADHAFPIVYEDMIDELREDLTAAAQGKSVPVYPFAYDWRIPLEQSEARLDEFIKEVINRTKLQPHYHEESCWSKRPTVNLIGHSMGGLIIAGYLEKYKAESVDKVVTIATPFKGSYEPVLKITTGTANMGDDSSHPRERRTARVTPSLYYLLPSFCDGTIDDFFDPAAWQSSVVGSIEDYIEKRKLVAPDEGASSVFESMLCRGRSHRRRISDLQLSCINLNKENWLAIVGVDAETRIGLDVERDCNGDGLRLKLDSTKRQNNWDSKDNQDRLNTGDGTVPLRGAVPNFLDENQLVCVTPDDFGYWEFRDKALTRLSGLHGILPNMNMLQKLVIRFITGKHNKYRDNTWGRRFPGVYSWNPPVSDLKEK